MELNNDFEVSAPIEKAWAVLTDVERIAPCLPGAQLQEVEGDEYRGIVKVKVGPITAQYKGKAHFVEQDEPNYRVVLKGEGRDTRGQGNASALITAQMVATGPTSTTVTVTTDLTVTGKVAQFGRGVMADVSGKLMTQFAQNLSSTVLAPPTEKDEEAQVVEEAPVVGEAPAVRKVDFPEPEAIDLMSTAGAPLLKRALPAVGVLALLLLIIRALRHRD